MWGDKRIGVMASVPKISNYLKACPTSFPGAQIASLSALNSHQGKSNAACAGAQGSVSTDADGKCPWQAPICSWHYIYVNIKKNKIMAFAATRVDLEIIILMKQVRQGKTNIWWYHLYLESKIIQRKWIVRHSPSPQSFLGETISIFSIDYVRVWW